MVEGLSVDRGSKVLDVAAGTGSITRLLMARGYRVTGVDITWEMLREHPGPQRVLARGEKLPFLDASFDTVTFGYLLRYVDDPVECIIELKRVLRPGGSIGMVEFGVPWGGWRVLWNIYGGILLPAAGRLIGRGWYEVGKFLKESVEEFHEANPNMARMWQSAGLVEVEGRRMSLGGGLVMWARKP